MAWLSDERDLSEVRDEGLFDSSSGSSCRARISSSLYGDGWYEEAGVLFRGIAAQLGEVEGPSGEVLRYGIDVVAWNASWWADLERRLRN